MAVPSQQPLQLRFRPLPSSRPLLLSAAQGLAGALRCSGIGVAESVTERRWVVGGDGAAYLCLSALGHSTERPRRPPAQIFGLLCSSLGFGGLLLGQEPASIDLAADLDAPMVYLDEIPTTTTSWRDRRLRVWRWSIAIRPESCRPEVVRPESGSPDCSA